jgi:NAD(P)-dependent dehydrogenase (short-subunit alcohol dehydrogenase family)
LRVKDKVIVVTGGAHGIGAALCRHFKLEGAKGEVVGNLDIQSARQVADEIDGFQCHLMLF